MRRNNISLRGSNNRQEFLLLAFRNAVAGKDLFENGDHSIPLALRNVQMSMARFHVAAVIATRTAGHLTNHGGNVVLEIRCRDALPRLLNGGVGVELCIRQEGVNEVAYDN